MAARIGAALLFLLFCLIGYAVHRLFGRGTAWKSFFLKWIGWILGLSVRVTGTPVPRNVLLVSNHVSWLDILALGGTARARFVAKAEVGRWPIVGMLARIGETILVERESRKAARGQADQLGQALAEGRPVVLFPEGTTGDGRSLLPFRPALLSPVAPPPNGIAVQPVAIDYGADTDVIAWIGDEGAAANALRIIGRPGRIVAHLHFLPPLAPSPDRKALAADAQAAIGRALAASAPDRFRL
jgi:1-acyl-sn-glycerol-3-phosphate acyltransferase